MFCNTKHALQFFISHSNHEVPKANRDRVSPSFLGASVLRESASTPPGNNMVITENIQHIEHTSNTIQYDQGCTTAYPILNQSIWHESKIILVMTANLGRLQLHSYAMETDKELWFWEHGAEGAGVWLPDRAWCMQYSMHCIATAVCPKNNTCWCSIINN